MANPNDPDEKIAAALKLLHEDHTVYARTFKQADETVITWAVAIRKDVILDKSMVARVVGDVAAALVEEALNARAH